MSTSAPAVARQRTATMPAWAGLALAFAIGSTGGAIVATVADQPNAGSPAAVELTGAQAELTSLIAKADGAADRGDVRLFIGFRDELAAYIGGIDVATYQDLRGLGLEGE
jgi:hypothetical protein